MKLTDLDLNLLVALEALLAEASVGRAAARLGLSQPAASHALRRLREALGDPLLVRVGPRMQRTPRAEALRAPLALALEQVRGLFVSEAFDPATSARTFRLMTPDLAGDLLLPALVEHLAQAAPGVRLEVIPWRGAGMMTGQFSREVDLVIAWTGEAYPGFRRLSLYADSDALAVRRDRPDAARLRQRAGFEAARHVAVIGAGEREDMIEPFLRQQRLERRVALVVPSYLQALRIAARSDLVAFTPRRLIAALAEPLGLAAVDPPVDPGQDQQYLFYPASMWLRDLVLSAGRALDPPRP